MNSYHELMPHALGRSVRPPSLASRALLGFLQLLLVLGIAAGVVLALYRNDILLGWARQAGKEAEYLRLEQQHLGGAPWGTQRSQASLLGMLAQHRSNAGARASAALRATESVTPAEAPAATARELNVVSVESLPLAEEPPTGDIASSPVDAARPLELAEPEAAGLPSALSAQASANAVLSHRGVAPSAALSSAKVAAPKSAPPAVAAAVKSAPVKSAAAKSPVPKSAAAKSPDLKSVPATTPPVKSASGQSAPGSAESVSAKRAASAAGKPVAASATPPVGVSALKAAIRSAVIAEQ